MRASELVELLDEMIDKHGDLEVFRPSLSSLEDSEPVGDVNYCKSEGNDFGIQKGYEYFYVSL